MSLQSEEGIVSYKSRNKALWTRLKAYAASRGMNIGDVMDDLLASFLDKAEPASSLLERQDQVKLRHEYLKSYDAAKKLRKMMGKQVYQTFSQAYLDAGGTPDYNLSEVLPKLSERFLNTNLGNEYVLFEFYLGHRQKMHEIKKLLHPSESNVASKMS